MREPVQPTSGSVHWKPATPESSCDGECQDKGAEPRATVATATSTDLASARTMRARSRGQVLPWAQVSKDLVESLAPSRLGRVMVKLGDDDDGRVNDFFKVFPFFFSREDGLAS